MNFCNGSWSCENVVATPESLQPPQLQLGPYGTGPKGLHCLATPQGQPVTGGALWTLAS
jgi:hypothetical protein